MKKAFLLLVSSILVATGIYVALKPAAQQSMLFVNGDIETVSQGQVEALWIKEGRIAALGKRSDVEALAIGAKLFDLEGGALFPGFVEPHTHPIATALLGQTINISGYQFENREQVMAALRERVDGFSLTPWAIAFGWDPALIDNLGTPSKAELDELSPDRPMVVLSQMMHDGYLNSAAIEALGLLDHIPEFKSSEFEVDARGQPTGVVREVPAINYIFDNMPEPPRGIQALLTSMAYRDYAKAGYTTIGTLGPVGRAPKPIAMLKDLATDPEVPVRNIVYGLPDQLDAGGWKAGDGWKETAGRFRVQGVKFWLDGSPWAGGAAWAEPYEVSNFTRNVLHLKPGDRGQLFYSQADLNQQWAMYQNQGFQIAVHAQGERAAEQALTAAAANPLRSGSGNGPRSEHNALVSPQQLKRMSEAGFSTGFFIDQVLYYGHKLEALVGDRKDRYMPIRSAFDAGIHPALHADSPATPPSGMRLLQTATQRIPIRGATAVAADQRLSRQQAIEAITINAAAQLGLADEVGSLAVGKRADLTYLSANPLNDNQNLSDIAVVKTWLGGRPVSTSAVSRKNLQLVGRVLSSLISSDQ